METSNTKHLAILRAGRELFWKYGFKRVSIEEICKKAGVSKMTYYKFFSEQTGACQESLRPPGRKRYQVIQVHHD